MGHGRVFQNADLVFVCPMRCRNLLTCTTASDADYASDWDPTTFICGDSPCDKPYVQSNLKDDGDLSCQEGEIVPSGATCTPNCKEGTDPKYVAVDTSSGATIASLACDRGTFTPLTYYCHSAASLPQYVAYKSRDVDAVVVNWAVGNPSDCVFSNWRMQYILTASATATAWTDILECTANTLEEGSTYKLRAIMTDWQTSAEITTLSLTPPVTIFTLPNADVYGSPGSIMAIKPGYSYRKIDVIKSGENCLPSADGTYNFSRYASVISTTSLGTEAGIEIAGSRIVIIKPDTAYWAGSCTYNISFEQASILPDTTGTIKELVAFWYNFTYIEIPPALSYITRNDAVVELVLRGGYNILWDKRTQMNCTASPKDAAVCAEKAQTAVLSPTSDLRCLPHNSTNDLIQELDVVLSFTIEGLYPGVEYFVVCAGWIPGQFWVPTVDIEDHWGTQQTFTTLTDTETGIASFQLTVYAVCSDGSIKQIYTSAMRTSEFELGYTAQIDHWIAACQPGISLQLSESVDFIYQGDIVTASANAYVQWDAGPNITVTYTKPADATVARLSKCPAEFGSEMRPEQLSSNMAAHQVLGQIVDIGFSYPLFSDSEVPGYPANADVSAPWWLLKIEILLNIVLNILIYCQCGGGSSLPPLHNSTGVALPTGYEELVLDVGAKLNFNIKVSQTSFDWNDATRRSKQDRSPQYQMALPTVTVIVPFVPASFCHTAQQRAPFPSPGCELPVEEPSSSWPALRVKDYKAHGQGSLLHRRWEFQINVCEAKVPTDEAAAAGGAAAVGAVIGADEASQAPSPDRQEHFGRQSYDVVDVASDHGLHATLRSCAPRLSRVISAAAMLQS
eukprot:s4454_g2.t1